MSNMKGKTKNKNMTVPVTLGQIYEVPVHSMGNNGEGVGRYENFTIFIPYALPEETVRVKIVLVKKTYAVGEIIEILTAAPQRITPKCNIYGSCGGCTLQHITYEGQLALKTQKVKDIIERIAKMDADIVLDTIGPKDPWQYRNKMQLPVTGHVGQVEMGFYARGSHQVVDCDTCHIQMEENNDILTACRKIMAETGVAPYNEVTGEGVIRHIIGRVAETKQRDIMVILVIATKKLPSADIWVKRLQEELPNIKSIVVNYNPKKTNVIMGKENTFLWGDEYIQDTIHDLVFRLSPHSFFQVNKTQTDVLYSKALEYADLTGKETVVDAYCGTGTISLFMAAKAKKVYGIEIVEPAIIDAKANAERNGFSNTEFLVADAAKAMPKLYKEGVRADVIMFDPVRAGCDVAVLEAAVAMQPERMVYVSCNPATMARDIAILAEKGYKTVKVQPVDMFPMTAHVECVAKLVRVKI